ncbi:hypothetical protein WICPIJ_006069 [Wickerhamomyces pijperi]|uniref:SMP-LTD domain-containing protein n=1 Tax=Wickerhamomyces pijperi TaxID=599730 RepID=A0A9P8Q4Z1_WICPI|nr:hypothetical protein WICPIJ_006069 [Wickerhamomyces pijperi]
MSFISVSIAFFLGGFILPPLLLVAIFHYLSVTLPKYIEEEDRREDSRHKVLDDISEFAINDETEYEKLKLTQIEEDNTTGVKAFKSGWITVTREYHAFASNAADKPIETKESKSAYTSLYRLVKKRASNDPNGQANTNEIQDEHQITSTAPADPKASSRRKNRYYGVLRHGNLFLYKDETLKNVQHVIVLSNHLVTLWPRGLLDAELFTKRSAICILKKTARRKSDVPPSSSSASLADTLVTDATADVLEKGIPPSQNSGFYIYCDTNYDKEDWYFELIKATKRETPIITGSELDTLDPTLYANTLHFKTADMISLIQTLHSSEGQMYTRWFNALVGRIFLAVGGTESFENVVRDRLIKKLSKINRPDFLDEFKIKRIDVGSSAPVISHPKLQELNPDGSLRIGLRFSYKGKISIQIATTANINLGSHFKTREVPILLAITVNKVEGPLAIRIKPPPSSRLWYTFEQSPDLDFTIEPVVSQRQLTYSIISKAIESRLKASINDSLVEPAWDDVSFFHSEKEVYRGGIWDTKQRPEKKKETEHTLYNEMAVEDDDLGDTDEPQAQLDASPTNIADVEPTRTAESGSSPSRNPPSDDDTSSIRSKISQSFSQKSSLSNFKMRSKKSEAVSQTSTEQFLSNGDFVLKEGTDSADSDSIRSNESGSKKIISNSIRKIGKWYNEKTNTMKSPPTSRESKDYHPPEMIQSRRRASSNISSMSTEYQYKSSSTHTKTQSVDEEHAATSPNHLKSAPQAHSFPPEYLFGLNTPNPDGADRETKNIPPIKSADMKSPYEVSRRLSQTLNQSNQEIVSTKNHHTGTDFHRKMPDRKKPPSLETKSLAETNSLSTEISNKEPEEFIVLDKPKQAISADIESNDTTSIITESPESKQENTIDTTAENTVLSAPALPPRNSSLEIDGLSDSDTCCHGREVLDKSNRAVV